MSDILKPRMDDRSMQQNCYEDNKGNIDTTILRQQQQEQQRRQR